MSNGAYYFPERFAPTGDDQNGIVGPLLDTVEDTDVWQITHKIHMVTGTGEMDTFTPPWPTFAGSVFLIGDGTWTWTNAGNIAIAGTGKANIAAEFVFNPVTAKWYPVADAVAD